VVNNLHRRAKAFGFVLQPLAKNPCCRFLAIVFQRQFANLGGQRLHVDGRRRRSNPAPGPKTSAAPPSSRFPRCDLIGMNVELFRKLNQSSIALDGRKATRALKVGVVIPARSSQHGLS
jgi:RNase P/RNase MRP subunit p29